MKIGELFVALNFKVDGQGDLAKAYNDVQNLGKASGALALGIGAMSAGFIAMISSSATAGNALKNFQNTTGLSAEKLQQWKHFAKQAVDSDEMVEPQVVKMQRKMADTMLSGDFKGLPGWTIFGLDPSADPFVMLDRLNAKFKTLTDPNDLALFGRLLQELDMGDPRWVAILRRDWSGKKLSPELIQDQKEINKLDTMSVKIRAIESETAHAANAFSSLFSHAVDDATGKIDTLLQKVGKLSKELNNGTPESEKKKAVLNTGAEVVGGTVLGLGAIATVTKILRMLGVAGASTGAVLKSGSRVLAPLAGLAGLYALNKELLSLQRPLTGDDKTIDMYRRNAPIWNVARSHFDFMANWRDFSNPRGFHRENAGGQNLTINVNGPYTQADGKHIGASVVEAIHADNNLTYLQTTMAGNAGSR